MNQLNSNRLKTLQNKQMMDSKLNSLYPVRVQQEFYRCVMKELEGKQTKERSPSGGVSIADACRLYLHFLQTGENLSYFNKEFGQSNSSMGRLLHQMTRWVCEVFS